MQPLKSRETATSPIEATAIALLRSAHPYEPPAGLKQRVRMRLLLAPSRRSPLALTLRPALIAGCILIAAGASAAIGGRWLLSSRSVGSQQPGGNRVEAAAARQVSVKRSAPTLPNAVTEAAPAAAIVTEPLGAPLNSAARFESHTSSAAESNAADTAKHAEPRPTSRAEPAVRTTPSTEKELVFDAMRALRREAQPERAARLLDEYMRRYPRGSLAEEALALAIEANSALGDPRVKNLADRYLAGYPHGRFRPAALRARARFSP